MFTRDPLTDGTIDGWVILSDFVPQPLKDMIEICSWIIIIGFAIPLVGLPIGLLCNFLAGLFGYRLF